MTWVSLVLHSPGPKVIEQRAACAFTRTKHLQIMNGNDSFKGQFSIIFHRQLQTTPYCLSASKGHVTIDDHQGKSLDLKRCGYGTRTVQKWCKILGTKDYINLVDIRSLTVMILVGNGWWPGTNPNLDIWDTRLIACRKNYKCLKCYLVRLQLILKSVRYVVLWTFGLMLRTPCGGNALKIFGSRKGTETQVFSIQRLPTTNSETPFMAYVMQMGNGKRMNYWLNKS